MPGPAEDALPSALERWEEIERHLAGRSVAVFLDYDGTLTPIVRHPSRAVLSAATRRTLRELAKHCPVVIVSGRGREDVARLVGLDGIVYAGSHGFDIAGGGAYPLRREIGAGALADLAAAAGELSRKLEAVPGAWVEDKKLAVAVHFRSVAERDATRVESVFAEVLAAHPALKRSEGKKVFELRPDIDWDKGRAVLWVLEALDDRAVPLCLGDDLTDEDAFEAIGGRGIGIVVADAPRRSRAGYRLRDPGEVQALLEKLLALVSRRRD